MSQPKWVIIIAIMCKASNKNINKIWLHTQLKQATSK